MFQTGPNLQGRGEASIQSPVPAAGDGTVLQVHAITVE